MNAEGMNIYLLLIIVRILCDIIVVVSILYPDSGHCYDETNHHHRHTLSPRFAPLLPFSHHHATSLPSLPTGTYLNPIKNRQQCHSQNTP